MKKTILFFGIVAGIFTANAQTTTTATAEVNVILAHSQGISVNHSVVALNYNTPAEYLEGVDSPQNDHLNVFSTGKYAIYFKADAKSVLNTGDTAIKISSSLGTPSKYSPLSYTPSAELSLSSTDQKLGSSAHAGTGKINVTYKGAKDNLYVNQLGGATKTLTTNVVYTILAE